MTERSEPTPQDQTRAARDQLLAQHQTLRDRMRGTLDLAGRYRAGEPVERALAAAVADLGAAFAAHNDLESSLLEPLLLATGAWGPARLLRMLEEHAGEHTAFTGVLGKPLPEVIVALPELFEDLEAHMAAEERTFLSAAVVRAMR